MGIKKVLHGCCISKVLFFFLFFFCFFLYSKENTCRIKKGKGTTHCCTLIDHTGNKNKKSINFLSQIARLCEKARIAQKKSTLFFLLPFYTPTHSHAPTLTAATPLLLPLPRPLPLPQPCSNYFKSEQRRPARTHHPLSSRCLFHPGRRTP